MRDVVYSIFSGNKNSIPVRTINTDFPGITKISENENIGLFESTIKYLEINYYSPIEKILQNNSNKIDYILKYENITNASKLKSFFDTQFPNNLKPIEYYQFKIKKLQTNTYRKNI